MGFGNLIRKFADETMRMTEGFDRVFGPQRDAAGVSRKRAGEKAARQRQERTPLYDRGSSGPQLTRGDNQEKRKLYDMDKNKDRRFF